VLKSAVFLDRDDTIIRDVPYLNDPQGITLLNGAAEAIRSLNEAKLPVIMVTNQSGIARGLLTEEILAAIHDRLIRLLADRNAQIDAVYYCPHHPEGTVEAFTMECACRKPAPGMLLKAALDFGLDLKRSYLVGDQASDVQTIAAVGGSGIIITPNGSAAGGAAYIAADLPDAVRWILDDLRHKAVLH
jgi:D-glycero-D-manno-heptose 1,7-bisphosphate phosphatase